MAIVACSFAQIKSVNSTFKEVNPPRKAAALYVKNRLSTKSACPSLAVSAELAVTFTLCAPPPGYSTGEATKVMVSLAVSVPKGQLSPLQRASRTIYMVDI
jgi:hypothetical protein